MPGAEFSHEPVDPAPVESRKSQLRRQVLAARRGLDADALAATAEALVDLVLSQPQVRPGACVAAYVSMGSEPGTGPLLAALQARGVRVLLPLLLDDNDLDWAPYAGREALAPSARGMREPSAPPLGVDAVAEADLVLVPGLAVSSDGHRLGRGGGSYDRALARVTRARGTQALTAVLLHPGEVGLDVPTEPHDQRVDAAVTRAGVTRFRGP